MSVSYHTGSLHIHRRRTNRLYHANIRIPPETDVMAYSLPCAVSWASELRPLALQPFREKIPNSVHTDLPSLVPY